MNHDASLLTPTDVAKILRMSPAWVRDHALGRRFPKLPAINLGSEHKAVWRFRRMDIDRFLEQFATSQ